MSRSSKGISWIENLFDSPEDEHRESFFKFILVVTVFAVLGCILGGLLDKFIGWIQGDSNAWWQCFGYVVLQLLVTSVVFYIMLKYIVVRPVPFDEWMINTFGGLLFLLTYFTSQTRLSSNSDCIIP